MKFITQPTTCHCEAAGRSNLAFKTRSPRPPTYFGGLAMTVLFLAGCAPLHPPVSTPPVLEEAKGQIHLAGTSPLMAGIAKVEITPPVGTPLAGYAKRRGKPSVGIRDPLYARVLTLSDGQDTLVFVSADLLIFPPPMARALAERIAKESKILPQAVVLAATHTHSGAGAIAPGFLYEKVFGRYQASVEEGIAARISWAVGQAIRGQQRAHWGIQEGPSLAGLTENRASPAGSVDASLSVLLIASDAAKPLAVLVAASAHPTLLDSKDLRFSADYPGEVCRALESAYPGAVVLFVNGSAGDLRPKDLLGSDPEQRLKRFGSAVAEAAAGFVSGISLRSHADLAAWGAEIPLPPPQIHLGAIPLHPAIGRRMRPSRVSLNLLSLEETVFVPLPAEATCEAGQGLAAAVRSQGVQPLLIGYANGYLGYAVTPWEYQRRTYEAGMSWYGPFFGEVLADGLAALSNLYPKKKK